MKPKPSYHLSWTEIIILETSDHDWVEKHCGKK